MYEVFALILDEAFWALNEGDALDAMHHFDVIKELIRDFERNLDVNIIPEELRVE